MRTPWLLAFLLPLALSTGCSCSTEPAVNPPPMPAPVTAVAPSQKKCLLVEIVEQNFDSFAAPLGKLSKEGANGIELLDGTLSAEAGLVEEADPAKLQAHGIESIGEPTSLAKARVVVAYRVVYEGRGREGGDVKFYLCSKFPARMELPASPAAAKIEHDLSRDGAFPAAMQRLRVVPEQAALEIGEPSGEGTVSISLGGKSQAVAPKFAVTLATASRTIEIAQAAIVAKPLQPMPGAAPLEIVPRFNYGEVKFTTRILAMNRGEAALEIRRGSFSRVGK